MPAERIRSTSSRTFGKGTVSSLAARKTGPGSPLPRDPIVHEVTESRSTTSSNACETASRKRTPQESPLELHWKSSPSSRLNSELSGPPGERRTSSSGSGTSS